MAHVTKIAIFYLPFAWCAAKWYLLEHSFDGPYQSFFILRGHIVFVEEEVLHQIMQGQGKTTLTSFVCKTTVYHYLHQHYIFPYMQEKHSKVQRDSKQGYFSMYCFCLH